MKKYLLILVAGIFSVLTANAYDVDGTVWTLYGSGVDGQNADQIANLNSIPSGVTTIKLVGNFSGWSGGILVNSGTKSQITKIDLSEAHFDNTQSWQFKEFTGLQTLVWPTDHSITTLPTQAFYKSGLTAVQIPNSVITIGDAAFKDSPNLATLTYEATPHVQNFIHECFYNTALTSVTIPGSARLIEQDAFGNIDDLTSVTFAADCTADLVVKFHAFDNSKNVTDVFILTEAHIQCEGDAFEDDDTYAHGQVSAPKATLHFPDSQAEYFTNLTHFLDEKTAADAGLFQAWLVEHYRQAQSLATQNNNGWWEFINAGGGDPSKDPEYPSGKFLMTYSHPTHAHIVPDGVKAYIVNDVVYNSTHKLYEVILKSITVIPANTGVILYGQTNANNTQGKPSLSMSLVRLATSVTNNGQTTLYPEGSTLPDGTVVDLSLRRSNWDAPFSFVEGYKNYLEPTAKEDGSSTTLYPFDTDSEGRVAFRNFGFGHFYKTTIANKSFDDYAGFFRCKKGKPIKSGMAYLRLAADEWLTGDELELLIKKDDGYYLRAVAKDQASAQTTYIDERLEANGGYWSIAKWTPPEDFGVRNSSIPASKFIGEPVFEEDETTGVAKILIPVEAEEEVYYNLNGQRVTNPTHGIFIKNGKKVIIK